MTVPMPNPGVRERLFIGDWLMSVGPSNIVPRREYGWADQERDSMGLLGRESPLWFPGICLAPFKMSWTILFSELTPGDAEILDYVQSVGSGPFRMCPWTRVFESFPYADGTGTLLRTDCLTGVPSDQRPLDAATKYAHYAYFSGNRATQHTLTLGTPVDDDRQPFSSGDTVLTSARYCPVFNVLLTDYEEQFEYAHRQHCKIVLTEV